MPPTVRQQLGDYLLTRLLGSGGMGSVFLARHTRTGEEVAIKVMAPRLTTNPKVVKRFETEARAVMRIDHPNVIRIHDYGRLEDGTLYHVMEVLDGEELTRLMERKRRFTPAEALPFVQQICMALQAAHERSIVHRDLKPENVFVQRGPTPEIKVLDFGIAKMLDPDEFLNLTATGVAIGTPMFIAPEQAMGDKHGICPQTDLYSLGVILYNMLAGTPPFSCEGVGALLAMHIQDPPPPLERRGVRVPPAVARVVYRCLEKEPAMRHRSAVALARDFEQAVRESGRPDRRRPSQPRRVSAPAPSPHQQDTVVDAHDPEDGRATIVDPRYQQAPPAAPVRITPGDAVPPSVLLGAPAPTRRPARVHWIALGAALLGVGLIVALLLLAAHLVS